ncbi:hypothetical protein BDP55DRAFT_302440 [Colletotrichum godetiae]|uniref:Uncharacterized protein n=1 Tax=Colletotrichum godetiae TaxID=1209918 RepID=A0AAJ0AVN7_9PEZI|nr:uncharacterized protein BDP55DRAFT_302440 [Colletotrichum godetiae]KAK1690668.1 hypothetical protein BDP55DRAFT_302440 [Colletotrichum godetiae]
MATMWNRALFATAQPTQPSRLFSFTCLHAPSNRLSQRYLLLFVRPPIPHVLTAWTVLSVAFYLSESSDQVGSKLSWLTPKLSKTKCGSCIDSSASHVGHGQYPIGWRLSYVDDFSRHLKSRVTRVRLPYCCRLDPQSQVPTTDDSALITEDSSGISIHRHRHCLFSFQQLLLNGLLSTSLLAETLALCIKLHQRTSGTNGALVLWFWCLLHDPSCCHWPLGG